MLVDAGVIKVSTAEKLGATRQRRFRAVAKEFPVADSLQDLITGDRLVAEFVTALILESARGDAEGMLSQYRNNPDATAISGLLSRSYHKLKPERVKHWASQIEQVIEQMERESAGTEVGELYGLTMVLGPLADPIHKASDEQEA